MDAFPYELPGFPPLLPLVLLAIALKAGHGATALLIDRYPDTHFDAMIRDALTNGALLVLGFVVTLAALWLAVAYLIVNVPGPGTWAWNPDAPPPIVIGLAVVVVLALAGRWAVHED